MILAIDTSAARASLALFDPESGTTGWTAEFVTERSHNSRIFTPLSEALDRCDRRLDLVAVGIGPGSYSGIRVGIAAANGIGLALDVPVLGFSSLEALGGEDEYAVAGDARRNSFFLARVQDRTLCDDPELMPEEDFGPRVEELLADRTPVLTMDPNLAESRPGIVLRYPDAGLIARKAATGLRSSRDTTPKPVEPHYLRPPYITKAKKKPVPGFPEPSKEVRDS